MIGLIALLVAASTTPPPTSNAELRRLCVSGISGSQTDLDRCQKAIREGANALADDAATGICMVKAAPTLDEAMWTWMDWIKANPPSDEGDSADSLTASLLSRYPCGWKRI